MAVTLEKVGTRVYLKDLPFAAKDRAKAVLGMTGNNFDRDRRAWWVGLAKREAAEKLAAELNAEASAPVPAAGDLPAAGAKTPAPATQEPDSARVYAKVTYGGRNLFVVAESHGNNRCKVCPLFGGAGVWVDMSACSLVKTYPAREYRGRETWTTLGSIRSFVEGQKKAEAAGLPQCGACGKRGHLTEDLEDGMMKCKACCDMPAD